MVAVSSTDATDQTVSALQSSSSREHWESRFNQLYIQPFLQVIAHLTYAVYDLGSA